MKKKITQAKMEENKNQTKMEVKNIPRVLLDVVIFACVFVGYHIADNAVPHSKRGFICKDPDLSLPFKPSTVRGKWLYVNLYSVPIIIWIIELALNVTDIKQKIKAITWKSLMWFKNYFFVFMCLIIFMATVKNKVGSYRPFFFEVCRPDLSINCTAGSFISSDYECTNTETSSYMLFDSARSFPSGHVVVTVYSCFYFMWYLQTRLFKFPLLLFIIYLVCGLWLALCSITRVTDHWHHWSDVCGGFLMTLPCVYFVCHVLCRDFKPSGQKQSNANLDEV